MDCLKLVEELNQEMYDKHGETTEQWYYMCTGFIDVVGFGDIMLWNSEDIDRRWIESKKDYEPLKPYLKKKLKKYGQLLSALAN